MSRLELDLHAAPETPTKTGDYLVRERFQRFPQIAHFSPDRGFRNPGTGWPMRVATWAGPLPPLTTTKGE